MATLRFPRRRGVVWRRIATGIAAAGLALGLQGIPPAAQGAGSGAQSAESVRAAATITLAGRVLPVGQFTPSNNNTGDLDFSGNGPVIEGTAALQGAFFGSKGLSVLVCMHAKETVSDFTEAGGCHDPIPIFSTAAGECIASVNAGPYDTLIFTDTDHAVDVFTGQVSGSFVQSWEVVGDTAGPEAGTETRLQIVTKRLTLSTITDC